MKKESEALSLKMNKGNAWLLAARPKTLVAAFLPIGVGTAFSLMNGGSFNLLVVFSALSFALLIQTACNFFNDAIDFQKGADTDKRLGPKRVVQSGLLQSEEVIRAAFFLLGLAFLVAYPLIVKGGAFLFIIAILSMFFAFAYTGGPFPIAYLGLGEFFVVPFFGLIPVTVLQKLLGAPVGKEALLAGLQVGSFAALLLSLNNARDIKEDRLVGKNTLAVRFGEKFSKLEVAFFSLFPFIAGIFWIFFEKKLLFFIPLLALPMAFSLVYKVKKEPPSKAYNAFLCQGAFLSLFFGALFIISTLIF